MKKIAIFVEGYTEQQFVIKLLSAIAGSRGVTFDIQRQHCGQIQVVELKSVMPSEFYILLVNCCSEDQVKSQVIRQHASLTENGYSKIVGLRDVFPKTIEELPMVKQFLNHGLPVGGATIDIILAIMEVEAWFLDELTHYSRIDASMTPESINDKVCDIITKRGYEWPNPAKVLHSIYSAWGLAYRKKSKQINRSVDALSDEEIYVTVREKAPSLDSLINSFEDCLFD